MCFYAPALGAVFSGDTLFAGGPGATGRSFSDFPTIIDSISHRLLNLPPETVVHTGHGDDTTIGAEAPQLDDWVVARALSGWCPGPSWDPDVAALIQHSFSRRFRRVQ